jgi:PPM family protein phosphatase
MENNFQYISAAITDRGLSDKRPQNEDSYLEINKRGLFAVADGVGGAQAGDVASSMAMEILGEAFVNMQPGSDAEDVMKLGIEKANSAIFQMSHELPQLSTMATTIVALHLSGNIATIGHVGDSRLYRLNSTGNLFRETQDHSVVEEEVRAGRMTEEQALNHPSRNVISRALGAEPTVEIDMKTIMVEPNDTFLICSDGITRHIGDNEIRELLSDNMPPVEICEQMKFVCYERGAEDNLTAVIVRISSEAARESDFDKHFTLELDEPTVASPRPPLVNTAIFSKQIPDDDDVDEIPTQNLRMTEAMQSHSSEKLGIVAPEIASETYTAPAEIISDPVVENVDSQETLPMSIVEVEENQNNVIEHSPVENIAPARYETREETIFANAATANDSGFFSKILSGLLFLIVGGLIGAGLHYFWTQSVAPQTQPTPQISQMQTANIPFSAFEENRRNVDKNPQQFISANAAAPQDAEDFYLLGRAYLLNKQYPEARKSFIEAKNKLGQTPETNSKILSNEIAMSLAIIDTPVAQRSFEQDVASSKQSTNTNSANANQ